MLVSIHLEWGPSVSPDWQADSSEHEGVGPALASSSAAGISTELSASGGLSRPRGKILL